MRLCSSAKANNPLVNQPPDAPARRLFIRSGQDKTDERRRSKSTSCHCPGRSQSNGYARSSSASCGMHNPSLPVPDATSRQGTGCCHSETVRDYRSSGAALGPNTSRRRSVGAWRRQAVGPGNGKLERSKKRSESIICFLWRFWLRLTSQELCGLRAQLSFFCSDWARMRACTPVKEEGKNAHKGAAEGDCSQFQFGAVCVSTVLFFKPHCPFIPRATS